MYLTLLNTFKGGDYHNSPVSSEPEPQLPTSRYAEGDIE